MKLSEYVVLEARVLRESLIVNLRSLPEFSHKSVSLGGKQYQINTSVQVNSDGIVLVRLTGFRDCFLPFKAVSEGFAITPDDKIVDLEHVEVPHHIYL